jgi:FPC/CPF motif-containing protein YcgG
MQRCGCKEENKASLKDILVGIQHFLQSVQKCLNTKESALANEILTYIDHLLENMDNADQHAVAKALNDLKNVLESYVKNSIDEADARASLVKTHAALEEAVSQKYSDCLERTSGVSW